MADRVNLRNDIVLVLIKGKYVPYKTINGQNHPIRGFNKNGQLVWRSYKTVEEAELNLFGTVS